MRKVAIIGTAPLSRDMAPFDDNEYEIWVCSAGNIGQPGLKRITRWFELHAIVELEAPENKSWATNYLKWLREQPFPVWMLEKNDLVPQAQVFPGQELIAEFGREWYTSSIAWMQALAIWEKVDEIGIFGVDMAADHEHYTGQRAGCRRFIEIAADRGIQTRIPWESCLGNPPPIYGYWEATPMGRRMNVTEQMLRSKRAELATNEERLRCEKCFFDGAIEQLSYFKRTFADGLSAFQHMGLAPSMDEAAKASIDRVMGEKKVDTSFSLTNPPEANTRLTPPPPVDMPVAAVGRPVVSLNGGGGMVWPEASKPHQRSPQAEGKSP